jgi:phosphoribosyl 1,2-cyclic phosphodiesterase
LFVHRNHKEELLSICGDLDARLRIFDGQSFSPLTGVTFTPLALAHDLTGSHGFVVDGFGGRIGYATDLGRVPVQLLTAFEDLDVLAIESNYDSQMQLASGRPAFLKQRIMGGNGHLSNTQALAAVRQILDRADARRKRLPSRIVLLHRSRECNCPKLLQRLFHADARIAPRLVLAEQYERTDWLRRAEVQPHYGEQLVLSWG